MQNLTNAEVFSEEAQKKDEENVLNEAESAEKSNQIPTETLPEAAESKKTTEHHHTRHQRSTHYRPAIARLRIILMFLMCVNLFGFPSEFSSYLATICGFVPIAFFILSGYLVLRPSKNRSARILRAIRRTAVAFVVLAVFYFILNFIFYRKMGSDMLSIFSSKRYWFNFIVLNVWQLDIGSTIWYVQSLLYAYIIIYFLDKWKLLRFDGLFAAILIGLTIVTGELSGVIRWNLLGYTYLPGNFLTRALPYVLLGSFLHKKIRKFTKIRKRWYYFAIVAGIILIVAEILLLQRIGMPGYYGHLLGMPIIALSTCILACKDSERPGFEQSLSMSRRHVNCIYYFCQPVGIALALWIMSSEDNQMLRAMNYISILTFLVSFALAWLIAQIDRKVFNRKSHGHSHRHGASQAS